MRRVRSQRAAHINMLDKVRRATQGATSLDPSVRSQRAILVACLLRADTPPLHRAALFPWAANIY